MNILSYLLCLSGFVGLSISDSQSPEHIMTESKFNIDALGHLVKLAESGTRILEAQHAVTVQLNNQVIESLTLLSDLSLVRLRGTEIKRNFFRAAEDGDERFIRAWIRIGVDVNVKDDRDSRTTALTKAAKSGYTSIVRDLLNAGANVTQKDYLGRTPLHYAVEYGRNEVVDQLTQAGANPNEKDGHEQTPLLEAASRGKTEVVKALLRVLTKNTTQGNGGSSFDDLGLRGNQTEEQLISFVVGLSHLSDTERNPQFFEAAENGDERFVRRWILIGLNLDGRDSGDKRRTALHKATIGGHASIVKDLLNAGAKPNEIDDSGEAPLHWAARKGKMEIVDQLIAAGAYPVVKTRNGETPLHYAASNGHKEIVDRLIKAGADPNAENNKRSTPLHAAAYGGRTEVVKALLEAGASDRILDDNYNTPRDLAEDRKFSEIVEIL